VDSFLDVGRDGREALIAVSFDTDEIVGVARFATDPSRKDQVEIALAVVDEWQFQGVGSSLFDRAHWGVTAELCVQLGLWRGSWTCLR
jgi:hypothetical protein